MLAKDEQNVFETLMCQVSTNNKPISLSVVDLKVLHGSGDETVKQTWCHKRSVTRQQLDSILLLFAMAMLAES